MVRTLRFLGASRCAAIVFAALVALGPLGSGTAAHAEGGAVDARIERVWPHDRQGNYATVAAAPLVNVDVYLFQRGTLNPVSCDFANPVTLRWAQNWTSHVGLPTVGSPRGGGGLLPAYDDFLQNPDGTKLNGVLGQEVTRTENGVTFPTWVFNDVPVEPGVQVGGTVTTYFLVEVGGVDYRTSVWAHGLDQRTLLPQPVIPQGVASATPEVIDSFISIVWPHDRQGRPASVTAAPLANVAVDLAAHPSDMGHSRWTSVGLGLGQTVQLYQSLDNGFLEPVPIQPKVIDESQTWGPVPGIWPRYEFDDVDVSAAQDPANTYYFAAYVDGITTHPTIWAHGADAQTDFPRADLPTASGAGC
ncbi:MAG: hypothetical protein ACRDIY_14910 [Chloroflexota bacterium]